MKDTTAQFVAQLGVGLVAAVSSAFLNRLMTAEELAVWPTAIQLGGFIAALGSWGLGDTFVRRVPDLVAQGRREEVSGLLRTGLAASLVSCVLVSAVCLWQAPVVARLLLHDAKMASVLQLALLAAFFWGVQERVMWAMTALQQFRALAVMNLVTGVLRAVLLITGYLAGGVRGFVAGLVVVALVSCGWSVVAVAPHLREGRRWEPLGPLVRFSWPFYGVSLVSLLTGRVNYLLIGMLSNSKVLASYFVADSVAGYLRYLGTFGVNSAAPKLAERAGGDPEKAALVVTKCTRYTALGVFPVCALGAVLSPLLIRAYGGSQYRDAGGVLAVLCLSVMLQTLAGLHEAALRAYAVPWRSFVASLFGPVTNLAPLVALVPASGSLGAGLATAIRQGLNTVASGWLLGRSIRLAYDWRAFGKALLASLPAALAAWACYRLLGSHAWVVLPAGAIWVAGYALGLTRQLRSEDLRLLEEALPQRLGRLRPVRQALPILTRLWVPPQPPHPPPDQSR